MTPLGTLPPADPDGFTTFVALAPVRCPSPDRRKAYRHTGRHTTERRTPDRRTGPADRREAPRPCRALLGIVGPGTVIRVRLAPGPIAQMRPGPVEVVVCPVCGRQVEKRTMSAVVWRVIAARRPRRPAA